MCWSVAESAQRRTVLENGSFIKNRKSAAEMLLICCPQEIGAYLLTLTN